MRSRVFVAASLPLYLTDTEDVARRAAPSFWYPKRGHAVRENWFTRRFFQWLCCDGSSFSFEADGFVPYKDWNELTIRSRAAKDPVSGSGFSPSGTDMLVLSFFFVMVAA